MRHMRPRMWNYHKDDFDGRTARLQATFSLSLAGISCATLHIQVNAHRQPQETGQESPQLNLLRHFRRHRYRPSLQDTWNFRMPRLIIASLIAIASFVDLLLSSAVQGDELNAAMDSISIPDIRAHIEVLADDDLEGREAGSRGSRTAAAYLAEKLADLGLKPGGDSDKFSQSFQNGNYRNLLAVLEGSDPELKQEYVLVVLTMTMWATAHPEIAADLGDASTTVPTTTPAAFPASSKPRRLSRCWTSLPNGRSCSHSGTARKKGFSARNTGPPNRPFRWRPSAWPSTPI